jgi:hypothetical protein
MEQISSANACEVLLREREREELKEVVGVLFDPLRAAFSITHCIRGSVVLHPFEILGIRDGSVQRISVLISEAG